MSEKHAEINATSIVVVPRSRVKGGKRTETLQRDSVAPPTPRGEAHKTLRKEEIDDVEERKDAERIAGNGVAAIRRNATSTPIGWVLPRERWNDVERDLARVRREAAEFNMGARYSKVVIDAIPIEIKLDTPEVAIALTEHIREGLESIRDLLRAGDLKGIKHALTIRYGNLRDLAGGASRQAIEFAFQEALTRTRELKEMLDGGRAPESAGKDLDLGQIESAIGWFLPTGDSVSMPISISDVA